MSWWYPKTSRADELTRRLQRLEEAFSDGLDAAFDRLAHLSERLAQALGRSDFPSSQIGRWIWVASQYRLHAETEPRVAALAASALVFLEEALDRRSLDDDHRRELNWILETVVGRLAAQVGPAHLKGCLSSEELRHIDERISSYDDSEIFDFDSVVLAVRRQLAILEKFGGLGDWASLSTKTDALLTAARRPGTENAPARAALRYLAERHDVVTDDAGVLGLIDDIYVLEWAYAAVEHQTMCLPILEAMSGRWPFVATLGLGARGAQLDRFGRYVVCAALKTLATPGGGALVLRETGPYPVIAAVAAAVEAVRAQAHAFEEEMELWRPGCPVTIGDGTVTFHARWGGPIKGTARPRYRLHVADAGSISVGEEVLPYLARAPREWKRLTNGTHILTWLKDRNVDGLIGLTGEGRRRPSRYEAVLLLTPRTKLDSYLPALRLQGVTPAALLGAYWIDNQGHSHALPGSATDRPLLYACGDIGAATDLLFDPPECIDGWRVLVDGAALGRTLHAALAASGRLKNSRLCVLAHLHERERVSALVDQGLEDLWYLEDQDVEVPPVTHPGKSTESDPLARFFARRSAHWPAAYSIRVSENSFLDAVADCLGRGNARQSGDLALDALDLTVAAFLRRATAQPLPDENDRRALEALAAAIVSQASMLAVYEPHAAEVRALFSGFASDASGGDRRNALLDLAASFGADEAVAVVCRSSVTADRCRAAAEATDALRRFEWMTIEALRASAPYDRVVVPGWLGRQVMRELSNVGFGARTDMLLLPYERRWYDRTISAGRRWEQRLERSTAQLLKRIVDDGLGAAEHRWHEQASLRVELQAANDVEPIDDTPDTAQAETRAIEGIRRVLPSAACRNETAKAQLVLFTDPGAFALLPPAGHVIVLPEGHDTPTADGDETRLLTSVAALVPGMLTALPLETDRDLVDAWADRMLADGGALRARADLWKVALKRHFAATRESYARFAGRMGKAGERRDALTIRSWANDTRSIAPRSYRRVLPLIADLTNDTELRAGLGDAVTAIDGVYRARAEASDAIVREIFSGTFDLSQPTIAFEVEGRRVVYALARVERLGGIQEVPSELVGRRLHLADLATHDGAVA
ncbi:hypothetical protein EJ070_13345 [Mesorhizobium sp. M1E.F.Ca.ET.045.02.1.1]|uniref:hypothetical protein n=1 Tax=Mesorhizobium sp. M1E.F.Ca.ET.045.02.1.1 TaxID=2493672 RepID=UPI000F761AF9|nr:hypothetical protein [Mesorhizobium sp. M1E.F.Ca.ET.045.02.1.1]AZO21568.1 hypothetical protein EJ070_13345 [Mesorhizobium sp. M1E.F.Ca.ET.045.02.1.1]